MTYIFRKLTTLAVAALLVAAAVIASAQAAGRSDGVPEGQHGREMEKRMERQGRMERSVRDERERVEHDRRHMDDTRNMMDERMNTHCKDMDRRHDRVRQEPMEYQKSLDDQRDWARQRGLGL